MNWDLEKYFPCYSPNLKRFLAKNGVRYYHTYIHHETGKRGWMYERNDELSELLSVWTNNKDSKST